jgi:hypothetical protein
MGRLAEALGMVDFTVRGETITALAQPHRFYLLQRVQDIYASASSEKRTRIDAVLSQCDLAEAAFASLSRRIHRADNLEVWD